MYWRSEGLVGSPRTARLYSPLIRRRICDGLEFLGIQLDQDRNGANAPLISTDTGRVRVRVIPTDEDSMIARSTARLLHLDSPLKTNP